MRQRQHGDAEAAGRRPRHGFRIVQYRRRPDAGDDLSATGVLEASPEAGFVTGADLLIDGGFAA